MTSKIKHVILAVLDGWGVAPPSLGNAIHEANTPNIDFVETHYPSLLLQASGKTVGLPWGNEGNSEVGHLSLGSGRIVFHYLPRIVNSIQDGSFFNNKRLKSVSDHVKKHHSSLHLIGLVSSGSVHSYIDHLYGLLEFAKRENIPDVYLHVFTDGKDSPHREAAKFLEDLQYRLQVQELAKISTIIGRNYSMDRSGDWQATQRAYDLLTKGKGEIVSDISEYIKKSYYEGVNDTYMEPAVLAPSGTVDPKQLISENDGVIFFNFREDSARQLAKSFLNPAFSQFPTRKIDNLLFTTMVQYENYIPLSSVLFHPPNIENTLAEVLFKEGKTQLHMAETEKYAHATYFFNGLIEKRLPGEERILMPSPGTPHYENFPEMAAMKITDKALENISKYDFILINYANADVLGHIGSFDALVMGIEAIDECVGKLMKAQTEDTVILITADHGNAEETIDPINGAKRNEHSSNPVPVYLIDKSLEDKRLSSLPLHMQDIKGLLSDIAPTVLDIMDIQIPIEMTGQSLIPLLLSELPPDRQAVSYADN